jgi:3'(2'), 5'-bisphosphate nucleotidase
MQGANIRISELISIAKEAGQKILEVYHKDIHNWEVSFKEDESPLTIADQISNKIINNKLKEKFPDIPIISEENKQIDYKDRQSFDLFWLVDPLDGTKEFIKRNGEFTVNIALVEKQKVIGGIVYVPVSDKMYYAQQGEGAFLIHKNEKHCLEAANFSETKEGLVIVSSRSHMNDQTKEYISQFTNPQLISIGSSLKLLLVAEGKADLYPRLGPTMEWDTAAAHAIVKEAGGKVIHYESREELVYNKENLLNPYFIVIGK